MNMSLIGSFGWANSYSKKQCRSLFWRLRAAMKKAAVKNGGKQQFKFQYDPSSYALNFDDGCSNLSKGGNMVKLGNNLGCNNIVILRIYVLW